METTIEVNEASQVAEVRRIAAELARAENMTAAECGKLALVATEASTNLVKYGKAGSVTLTRYAEGGQHGVQLIAVDSGPGFADFVAATRDGHSTAGSLGIGLGVIMRSSTFFDVYSVPGEGTAMVARVAHAAPRKPVTTIPPFEVAVRSIPKKGQVECGDAWSVRDFGTRQLICIVDGLGHGPLAAQASARAIAVFEAARADATPAAIMTQAHEQLKDTRGAVMAILALDPQAGTADYCGIGNIAAAIHLGNESKHLLSVEGTVGYRMRATRTHTAPWESTAVAVLYTDGLSGRWGPAKYPGLLSRHPSLIASVLFRDHARDTDDATIVVARRS
ncbi:MAG: putative anti-sigma regulatory factor, serine/threonine protein kinase [Ramlibacter sp.]|jgi:anti-sigma regulatory factor (Ser/Thr protein kinase)|nr:putative anti-sigma regulatory factor, serine/threonine protein kinase [Ramlibacter sp.]